MTVRDGSIPVIGERNTIEKLKEDEGDEPSDGHNADGNGSDPKTALDEYAVIEK